MTGDALEITEVFQLIRGILLFYCFNKLTYVHVAARDYSVHVSGEAAALLTLPFSLVLSYP